MRVLEFYMHTLDEFWGGMQIGDLQFVWCVLHVRVFVKFVDYVDISVVFNIVFLLHILVTRMHHYLMLFNRSLGHQY